jgi:hypothetical protein
MGLLSLPLQPAAAERRTTLSIMRRLEQDSLTPLAWLILPNLPLLVLRHKLTLVPHGLINIECLLVGACSVFLPRLLIFLLLLLEIGGAFAYEVCYSFQIRFVDLLTTMRSLGDIPATRKEQMTIAAAASVAIAAMVAFAVRRPRRRWRAALILLAMVVLFSAVDLWDGQNPLLRTAVQTAPQRLTLSPWIAIGVRDFLSGSPEAQARRKDSSFMPSATSAMMSLLRDRARTVKPDVVVVLVESWGLMTDPHLANMLTSSYDDARIEATYDVRYGTAPFDGMTVPGEVRELCHTHLGFGVLHISALQSAGCLPEEFAASGYTTYAVHGYVGNMFQRVDWYKRLGFQATWFAPDLSRVGLPECPGAFPGICDPSIAGWIGKELLAEPSAQPHFVYWVTLNSHIPLPLNPQLPVDDLCASRPALAQSSALCSWFRLIHALHASVARAAGEATERPTVFVLAGDHAPPFANPALRQNFSSTVVPWVILMPKALRCAPAQRQIIAREPAIPRKQETISRVESGIGQGR